ncbi:rhodanese-like domain-containing protein [Micromonospora thermarum]|uniref:Rhodanese-like domain-containing protein n=1 Tax=Micromonospora thermarum TaxID=2720024 RepID=A0ABX0ZIH0_9ACTN|nr:rhodanese-like domain-containing protein [Micromonospora thermarum]NJP35625.1 rhodanese-like domain-containing protein [Micromonospora thermarum]
MNAKNATSAIDVATARALLANNPDTLIVDVRTPGEFETAHVAGSINLPLDQVDAHLGRIVNDAGGRLLLMCQSGNRATQACTKLVNAGLSGATVITGGMNAWISAGGPVERGRERWSLERQVRLIAGGIVLLSVVASIWLPPARFVAGFIGAGLTFAALTNTCAMGAMLSRLPYNRGAGCDVNASLARLRNEGRRA